MSVDQEWSNVPPGFLSHVVKSTSPAKSSSQPYVVGVLLGILIAATVWGASVFRSDSGTVSLSCQETVELMDRYHHDQLAQLQHVQVEKHLEKCLDCNEHYRTQYGVAAMFTDQPVFAVAFASVAGE